MNRRTFENKYQGTCAPLTSEVLSIMRRQMRLTAFVPALKERYGWWGSLPRVMNAEQRRYLRRVGMRETRR
jgi:hypothetical protein